MRRGGWLNTLIMSCLLLFVGAWIGLCAANIAPLKPLNNFTRDALVGLGIPVTNYAIEPVEELRKLLAETPEDKKPIVVAEIMKPSVVGIITISEQGGGVSPFGPFGTPAQRRVGGQASGVIVREDGTILTNYHVVAGALQIYVQLSDGRTYKAELVGTDMRTDLAVIRIKGAQNLVPAALGNSDEMLVAERVLAFGTPFGLTQTVTEGIISAKGRANVGIADYEDFIQTDAAINPGNSGGPLVNMRGEVIGINTAILSTTGSYSGISFAIPMKMAKAVEEQLVKFGKVTRGYLGIVVGDLTPDKARSLGVEGKKGALVVEATPGSPAEKAGLKADDLITGFNGEDVDSVASLRSKVALTEIGKTVKVKFIRDGKEQEADVTVVQEPQPETYSGGPFGLVVSELDDSLRRQYRYSADVAGAVVVQVKPDSIFAGSAIREGVVISRVRNVTRQVDTIIRTLEDYKKAVEGIEKGDTVDLELRSGTIRASVRIIVP